MATLFAEIEHAAKYLNSGITGKRTRAKKFMELARVMMQTQAKAYKSADGLEIKSFFFNIKEKALILYTRVCGINNKIAVQYKHGVMEITPALPLIRRQAEFIKFCLLYYIPSQRDRKPVKKESDDRLYYNALWRASIDDESGVIFGPPPKRRRRKYQLQG